MRPLLNYSRGVTCQGPLRRNLRAESAPGPLFAIYISLNPPAGRPEKDWKVHEPQTALHSAQQTRTRRIIDEFWSPAAERSGAGEEKGWREKQGNSGEKLHIYKLTRHTYKSTFGRRVSCLQGAARIWERRFAKGLMLKERDEFNWDLFLALALCQPASTQTFESRHLRFRLSLFKRHEFCMSCTPSGWCENANLCPGELFFGRRIFLSRGFSFLDSTFIGFALLCVRKITSSLYKKESSFSLGFTVPLLYRLIIFPRKAQGAH